VLGGRGASVGAATNFGFDNGEFHEDEVVLQHPLYRAADYSNDVMLVKLETGSLLSPIQVNQHPWKPLVGANLTVMGFGDTSFQGDLSENLLETTVFVSNFEECAALYWNQSETILNETTQFCALGEEVRDACQADSGGPMIGLDVNGEAEQVGIVSFGLDCGQENENVPAVYVRVGAFSDWIQAGICQLSSFPPARCHDASHNTQQGGTADAIAFEELGGDSFNEEPISSSHRANSLLVMSAALLVSTRVFH
jgi:secreted trypsin-like serine protease